VPASVIALVVARVRQSRDPRQAARTWAATLVVSAALTVLLALGRPHKSLAGAVFAGFVAWALLAAVIGGVFALSAYLLRQARRPPSPAGAGRTDGWDGGAAPVESSTSTSEPSAPAAAVRPAGRRWRWQRWLVPWPAPTANSREWPPGYAVAALVLAQLLALVASLALGIISVRSGVGAPIVECSLLITMLPLCRSRHVNERDLGLRSVPGARSVGFAVLGFLAYGLSSGLWRVLARPPGAAGPFRGLSALPVGTIVLSGLTAVFFAPVVEEIFFRGFLYRSMRNRMSTLPAALAAGALFGAIHWDYPLAVRPELMFFGVITALMYEQTGSLLPGIALHSFIDSSGFFIALNSNAALVALAFATLALALLALPPLRSLGRLARGQPAFRDYTLDGALAVTPAGPA
jgi:membrane protease YdiL (CAAX protease family)